MYVPVDIEEKETDEVTVPCAASHQHHHSPIFWMTWKFFETRKMPWLPLWQGPVVWSVFEPWPVQTKIGWWILSLDAIVEFHRKDLVVQPLWLSNVNTVLPSNNTNSDNMWENEEYKDFFPSHSKVRAGKVERKIGFSRGLPSEHYLVFVTQGIQITPFFVCGHYTGGWYLVKDGMVCISDITPKCDVKLIYCCCPFLTLPLSVDFAFVCPSELFRQPNSS